MGKLSNLINKKPTNRLSSLLGVKPSEPTESNFIKQSDITRRALEKAESDIRLGNTKDKAVISIAEQEARTPQQIAIDENIFLPAEKRAVKERTDIAAEEYNKSLRKDPRNILENPFVSKLAGAALSESLGIKSLPGRTGQEFQAGVASSVPVLGKALEPSAKMAEKQSTGPKADIKLPFVGDVEATPVGLGKTSGTIGATLAQYGAINKVLEGLGATTKLGQILGGSKPAKFVANQGVDLLADVLVQAPTETLDAIYNDKTLAEDAKQILTNRAIDVGMNLAIGGSSELLKTIFKTDPNAVRKSVDQLPPEQAKQIREVLETKVEIPLSPALKEPDAFKGVKPTEAPIAPKPQEIPTQAITEPKRRLSSMLDDDVVGSPRVSDFPEPVVGKSKSPFAERVKDLISDDPTVNKLKRRLDELELSTTSNQARTQAANEIVNQDLETALKLTLQGDRFGSAIESEMGRSVVDQLNSLGRNAEAVEVIAKMSEKFRSAGKDVQAASIWSKTSPEGMQKWAVDTLEKAEVKVDEALIQEVAQDMKRIQDYSVEELAEIVAKRAGGNYDKTLDSIKNSFSYDQLKAVNTAITMNKVISKIPVLKARKLSSLQAMSHLLNPKTFNRNILGNAASLVGEALSKYPASVADRALSMATKNRSVVAGMPSFKKSMLEGWEQGKRSFFEIKAGVGKGKTGKYEALFGDTFKSKPGKFGERLMSWSLQTPDEFFKGFSKADSLYNQVSARLGPQVKKWSFDDIMNKATIEEIDTAIKEAEFTTFQNDSFLADVLSSSKKGLNSLSTGLASRVPGLKNLFSKDFGLGDMVVKYTRVPGNIMTRGFEYSPLGYYKAGEGIFKMMNNLDSFTPQQQREIALQIGRATTGTGLFFLGKKLNELGIITDIDGGTDYNAQAFERAEGLGNYKVNIDALGRLVKGEDPTRQAGDTLKSFNWAAPMITPIAVGAKMGSEGESITDLPQLGLSTFEQSMDLPSLFIAKQIMYESMKENSNIMDMASVPLKEAIPGFVPSTVRQVSQFIDPTFRDTSGGANVPLLSALPPNVGGKIQGNLPFLSKKLPARLDVLGREQTRKEGIFPSLIDPATTTTFTPTAFGDKIRLVEEITGESNFFPDRKPPNSITFKGEKLELTPQEKEEWQRIEGQNVNELYTEMLQDVDVDDQNAFVIAKQLSKMKSIASRLAKANLIETRFGGN